MDSAFNYATAPFIVTAAILILILIIFLLIRKSADSKSKITSEFVDHLKIMSGAQYREFENHIKAKTESPIDKWNTYWGTLVKKAGIVESYKYTNEQIGQLLFLGSVIFYTLVSIIFSNYGIGLVPIFSFFLLSIQILEVKAEKRQSVFDEQIPAFLSLLKSNIQAGETPERALMSAIDETDAPLYDELKTAKALIEIGSFQSALSQLRMNTSSEVLKFLCGCIELSASVGANLEDQIDVIEEMLDSNRRLKRKLKVAIAQSKPLLILSSVMVPFLFIYTYLANEQMRSFWFKEPISWVAFILAMGIYGGGTLFVKFMIKKTGEF